MLTSENEKKTNYAKQKIQEICDTNQFEILIKKCQVIYLTKILH